jgi:hypothetical protein
MPQMKTKGQMTLEIVIMLTIVISIFLHVSSPAGLVGRAAVESVGTAALAEKAITSIGQKADIVGISGEGAKDYVEVAVSKHFDSPAFSCSSNNIISVAFTYSDTTDIHDTQSLGLQELINPDTGTLTYTTDFDINCDNTFTNLSSQDNSTCICFENTNGDDVDIKSVDKPCYLNC